MVGQLARWATVLVLGSGLWLTGCTQVRVPDQIGNSLRTLRTEMELGRGNIERTTAALGDLRSAKGALIKPTYATYLSHLTALEEKAGGVGAVGTMTDSAAAKFFAQWEQQINEIRDADVSQAGRERREDVMKAFDGIKAQIAEARTAYRPYFSSLCDIKTCLDADLTEQGLAAARPAMDKAQRLEPAVLSKIDATIQAIDKIVHP